MDHLINLIKRNQKVIPSLIDKFKLKNKIKVWGEGKDIKDFMFIEDFIDALILVVNRYKKFTIMNIASGKSIKLEKIINFLKNIIIKIILFMIQRNPQ